MASDATVEELRDKIAALTGRMPNSRDRKYLVNRLKMLEPGGPHIAAERPDYSVPVTVSMITERRKLLAGLCKEMKVGASTIVQRALDLYASQHGYADQVARIQRSENVLGIRKEDE